VRRAASLARSRAPNGMRVSVVVGIRSGGTDDQMPPRSLSLSLSLTPLLPRTTPSHHTTSAPRERRQRARAVEAAALRLVLVAAHVDERVLDQLVGTPVLVGPWRLTSTSASSRGVSGKRVEQGRGSKSKTAR
jgi:hypothetical protein